MSGVVISSPWDGDVTGVTFSKNAAMCSGECAQQLMTRVGDGIHHKNDTYTDAL